MNTKITLTALALAAAFNTQASEEPNLEHIQVTGDFRQQDLKKHSASVSVLTEADIESKSADHLEELLSGVANVNFSSGTSRARFIQIRGIGLRSEFTQSVNPSVGLIVDDIDLTGMGAGATLYGIKQAEIFKGPQGVRFGSNALAGLLYLSSDSATDTQEGEVTASMGNYGLKNLGASYSNSLDDSVNIRVSAHQHQSDGYIDNTFLGRKDTNNRDELTLRTKVDWTVDESNQLTFNLLKLDVDNGYDAFSLDNTRETLSDEPGHDTQDTTAFGIKWTHQSDKGFDVTTTVSRADSNISYGYDEDWSYEGIAPGWEYSSFDNYLRERSNTRLEVIAVSQPDANILGDSTQWALGLYARNSDASLTRQYTYQDGDFSSDLSIDKQAIFGQLTTQISEDLSLDYGLRLERFESSYSDSETVSLSPSDTMLGGKLAVNYDMSDSLRVFASVNRGYKIGGFNIDGTLPQELREFDPEYVWNYEAGLKHSVSDDAYVGLTVFFMNREDIQIKSYVQKTRDDGSTEWVSYYGNGSQGRNQGIEFEAGWKASATLSLSASFGLLDTKFKGFVNENGEDLSGRDQAHAPSYQYQFAAQWDIASDLYATFSIEGKDEFFFSSSHDEKSKEMHILNASITYVLDNWKFSLWGRNLTGHDYYVRGFGGFGNDPRKEYTTEPYYQYGEPAVFGLNATMEF